MKTPLPRKNKIGKTYGHWKVIAQDIENSIEIGKVSWICECDCGCGTRKTICSDSLNQTTIGGCDNMRSNKKKECLKCHQFFYPKKQAKTRKYCYDCYPEGESVRHLIKRWALDYKGHQCSICGYNKSEAALDFHHLDPNEKDFIISDHRQVQDWENIKLELDKCIVICANCHRELHEQNNIIPQKDSNTSSKKIKCLTTNEVFNTLAQAAEHFNLSQSTAKRISEVCKGTRDSAGKNPITNEPLTWAYADISEEEQKQYDMIRNKRHNTYGTTRKPVICLNNNKVFDSIKEASLWCNLKSSSPISAMCKGSSVYKTAGKDPITKEPLTWAYYLKESDE